MVEGALAHSRRVASCDHARVKRRGRVGHRKGTARTSPLEEMPRQFVGVGEMRMLMSTRKAAKTATNQMNTVGVDYHHGEDGNAWCNYCGTRVEEME